MGEGPPDPAKLAMHPDPKPRGRVSRDQPPCSSRSGCERALDGSLGHLLLRIMSSCLLLLAWQRPSPPGAPFLAQAGVSGVLRGAWLFLSLLDAGPVPRYSSAPFLCALSPFPVLDKLASPPASAAASSPSSSPSPQPVSEPDLCSEPHQLASKGNSSLGELHAVSQAILSAGGSQ